MTIRDLSEKIGVSPATISIVLNEKKGVREETRQQVLKAVKEYGYTPTARSKRRKQEILLVKFYQSGSLIEENQGFISMIIDSIEETLREEHYSLTPVVAKETVENLFAVADFSKYCGMILIASEITKEMYNELKNITIPFVIVDNPVPNFAYSSVCMNNYENVCIALTYCRDCGHKKVGYFRSAADFENFRQRNNAFRLYSRELGLEFDPINEFRVQPTLLGAYEGIAAAVSGRTELPRCFFSDNDTIALGAIKALKEKGYKIPEDISVIGFDDIPFAAVSSPALTTIHVQRKAVGRQAVYQLLRTLEDPEPVPIKSTITGRLVIRGSVKELVNE